MHIKSYIAIGWVLIALASTSLWKLFPETKVDLFILIDEVQTIQWYVFDTTEMLKQTIFIAIIYSMMQTEKSRIIMGIILWYSIIRIFDYFLWRNKNDVLLEITFVLIISAYFAYKLIKGNQKREKKWNI